MAVTLKATPSGHEPPPELTATRALLATPRAMSDFHLTAADGSSFTRATLHGNWTLLVFGYTHCPDVCPTTLARVASALESMEHGASKQLSVRFISVDPERDMEVINLELILADMVQVM